MSVRIVAFSLAVLVLFPITVHAQETEEVVYEFPFAFTQSVVRSPEGQLLVYQENYAPVISNQELFNQFLNNQLENGNAELLLLDTGTQTLEMISLETTETFESDQLRAWDNLIGKVGDEFYNFAIIFHEGYPVSEGDTLTIKWTFVRQT